MSAQGDFTSTTSDGQAGQTNVVSNIDGTLALIFSVSGMPCNDTTTCWNSGPDIQGSWNCAGLNNTIDFENSALSATGICLFTGCIAHTECDGGEYCWNISHCSTNNTFYDESLKLTSSVCLQWNTCNSITQISDDPGYYTDEMVRSMFKTSQ